MPWRNRNGSTRNSPRPIHSPSSRPPRQILLLASAFFKKGENAAAATVNLHRHKQACRLRHEVLSQHWAASVMACNKNRGNQVEHIMPVKLLPQQGKYVWVKASFAVLHYNPIGGTKDHLHGRRQ